MTSDAYDRLSADIGVEPDVLYQCGKEYLGEVAENYSAITTALHRTTSYDSAVFTDGQGRTATAYQRLMEFRDMVHGILYRTTIGVMEAGESLADAAGRYVATDEEVAAEFENEIATVDAVDVSQPSPPEGHAPSAPSTDAEVSQR